MITSISSSEVINFVLPDPKMFFWIAASFAAAAATVNPNGIKNFLS